MRTFFIPAFFVLFVFCFLAVVNAKAQTQTDSINIKENKPGFYEGISGLGEKIISYLTWQRNDNVLVVYPSGGYSPRTGLYVGATPMYSWKNKSELNRWDGHPNSLTSSFQISTNDMVELNAELEWFPSKHWQIRSKGEFVKINDRLWGIPSLNVDDGVEYLSKHVGFTAEILYKLGAKLFVGGTVQLFDYSFNDWDKEVDATTIFGSEGGLISGLGPVVMFDSRDHILYPLHGSFFKGAAIINDDVFGGNYRFQNYLFDFRQFTSLNRKVLATQLLWEYSPGDVPFYMLPKLGGKDRLRGIGHSQRIINQSVWLLQSELRMPLWWRFGAVVFAGMGEASVEPSVNFDNLIYSGGIGLRFRILPDEPLNVRIDAALASGGLNGFFVCLKEPF